MADSPYGSSESGHNRGSSSSSTSSSGRGIDRGHGSSFFSSMSQRGSHGGPHGFGSRNSEGEESSSGEGLGGGINRPHPHHFGGFGEGGHEVRRMERFRGPYVEEPLIPALIYVTLAGFTGSIIARKSNFVYRFLSPVALALGASAYCIPRTTNNILMGLRTFDYGEWSREWQHKWFHAKKSVIDSTHELQAGLGSVAHSAKDAANDLSDKTQKVLHDVKDKTVEVANDLKDKTEDVGHDLKTKSKELGHQLEHAKDQVKDSVDDKADQAKHWWNTEKRHAERSAQDFRRSAEERGDQARDWFHGQGGSGGGWERGDFGRGVDNFKAKARQGWEEGQEHWRQQQQGRRPSFDHWNPAEAAEEMRHEFGDEKDRAESWGRRTSRDFRDRFEDVKDAGQGWLEDRGRDLKRFGRDQEDQFVETRHQFKKHGQEIHDFGEDRFRDARRDIRNRAEDLQDHGRRAFHKFDHGFEDAGGRVNWGFGAGRPGEDDGRRGGRFEGGDEFRGRGGGGRFGGDRFDPEPRRSVTEAAQEAGHWWHRKGSAADPYESFDRGSASQESLSPSTWWKAGGGPKDHGYDLHRGVDQFKDSVENKARERRSWTADKKGDLKHMFEQPEYGLEGKFGRGSGHFDQGRDFGMGGGVDGHNHASVYSNDNWFHYDHGEDNRASRRRGRDRGM